MTKQERKPKQVRKNRLNSMEQMNYGRDFKRADRASTH
ncbi:MAG: YfhE family protein [Bacilli bacterium]